jgi:hypothetical protein
LLAGYRHVLRSADALPVVRLMRGGEGRWLRRVPVLVTPVRVYGSAELAPVHHRALAVVVDIVPALLFGSVGLFVLWVTGVEGTYELGVVLFVIMPPSLIAVTVPVEGQSNVTVGSRICLDCAKAGGCVVAGSAMGPPREPDRGRRVGRAHIRVRVVVRKTTPTPTLPPLTR